MQVASAGVQAGHTAMIVKNPTEYSRYCCWTLVLHKHITKMREVGEYSVGRINILFTRYPVLCWYDLMTYTFPNKQSQSYVYIAFFIIIIYCHRRIFTSEPTIAYQCPNSIVPIRIHAEGLKHGMMIFTHQHKRQKREYFHCPTTDLGQLASPFSLAQLCPFTWWQPCSTCPFQTQDFRSLPPPSMCFHNLLTQLFWWRRRFPRVDEHIADPATYWGTPQIPSFTHF